MQVQTQYQTKWSDNKHWEAAARRRKSYQNDLWTSLGREEIVAHYLKTNQKALATRVSWRMRPPKFQKQAQPHWNPFNNVCCITLVYWVLHCKLNICPEEFRKLLIAPSPLVVLHVLWYSLWNVAKCTHHFPGIAKITFAQLFPVSCILLDGVWQATRLLHTFKRPPKHLIPTQPILLAKLVAKKLCWKTQGSSIVWRHYAIPCVQNNTTVWEHLGDIRSPFRW